MTMQRTTTTTTNDNTIKNVDPLSYEQPTTSKIPPTLLSSPSDSNNKHTNTTTSNNNNNKKQQIESTIHIHPPTTTNDNGEATESLEKDAHRVFALMEDERHITAYKLLQTVQQRIHDIEKKYKDYTTINTNTTATTITIPSLEQSSSRTTTATTETTTTATTTTTNNVLKNKQQQQQQQRNKHHLKLTKNQKYQMDIDLQLIQHVREYLQMKNELIHKLYNRYNLFRTAQQNLNETNEWIYASHHFGITTYYRREAYDDSLSIKLEGDMKHVPLFEQVAVLKEVDLHHKWSPFCSDSKAIAKVDKLDVIGWFLIGLPKFGLSRDGCFRAIGCDNISEDGSIILAGRGIQDDPTTPMNTTNTTTVNNENKPESNTTSRSSSPDTFLADDPIIQQLDIPPVPTRRGSGRMTIRKFEAVVHIIDVSTARTRVVANFNPNISFLPNPLLEFVMKHLAGVMLAKLQHAAKKACNNPIYNEHARLMRHKERSFYHDWLLPKFEAVCIQKGWEIPIVSALNLSPSQLQEEQEYFRKCHHHQDGNISHDTIIPRSYTANETSSDEGGIGSGGIVENLSELTNPGLTLRSDLYPDEHHDHVHHHDLVSELSIDNHEMGTITTTTTSGMNNPVSNLFRFRKKRTKEQEYADKKARDRKRTALLLKPKPLSYQQQERLIELKKVKAIRLGLPMEDTTTSTNINQQHHQPHKFPSVMRSPSSINNYDNKSTITTKTTDSRRRTITQWFTKKLLHHDHFVRFFAISFFVNILFVLLHADFWLLRGMAFVQLVDPAATGLWMSSSTYTSSWSKRLLLFVVEDGMAVGYLLLCAVIHFFLCYISLIYAFSSLELGSKMGNHVKKYYSDNVHIAMGTISFGIVAVSIGKSLFFVSIRMLLWYTIQIYNYTILEKAGPSVLLQIESMKHQLHDKIPYLDNLPIISNGLEIVWTALTSMITFMLSFSFSLLKLVYLLMQRYLLESNDVGRWFRRSTVSLFQWCIRSFLLADKTSDFVTMTGPQNQYEQIALQSWRYDAFVTARVLFTYTSVFLLTLLILFTITARKSTKQVREKQRTAAADIIMRGISTLTYDGQSMSASSSSGQLRTTASTNSDKQSNEKVEAIQQDENHHPTLIIPSDTGSSVKQQQKQAPPE